MLAALPERTRKLIVRTKVEGFSNAEAGAEAGLTETAAKVRVHRGLKLLSDRLVHAVRPIPKDATPGDDHADR
jgi:DNA-directed RNA polymerase specialized sigma24 family protein